MLATKDVLRTLLRGIMQCIRRLGLPEVTAAENGHILKVVRGAWAAVQPDPITTADLPQIPAEKLPETVPVPASVGQAGQVLGVQADGTKGYVWPQLMDGTLTPGYRVTANGLAQYFVIDVAQPWLGRFTLPSVTTRVEIRNYSTGETISQYGLNTPAEVNVRIVSTRIISLFCTYSTGLLRRYDYLFVAQNGLEPGWHVQDLNYTKTETDTLLAAKLDAPAVASVGQTLRATAVDSSGKPTAWRAVDPWIVQSSDEGSPSLLRLYVDDNGNVRAIPANMLPYAANADGTVYNGTGCKDGFRLDSSGQESALAGFVTSGFLPYRIGYTLLVDGGTFAEYGCMLALYDETHTQTAIFDYSKLTDKAYGSGENSADPAGFRWIGSGATIAGIDDTVRYLRFSCKGSGADLEVYVRKPEE